MNKPKSFYVVYPANQDLRNLLNSLKYIADENQRTEAHITVRGPYVNRLSKRNLMKFSAIIKNEELQISKVDNFFAFNQNTVFFKCDENENLKAIWKKLTYNEFRPHITIYDGDNEEFAHKLFNKLSSDFKPFTYRVSALEWLEPKSNQTLDLYYLKSVKDFGPVLESIVKKSKYEIDFSSMTLKNRLNKISKIAERLYQNGF